MSRVCRPHESKLTASNQKVVKNTSNIQKFHSVTPVVYLFTSQKEFQEYDIHIMD